MRQRLAEIHARISCDPFLASKFGSVEEIGEFRSTADLRDVTARLAIAEVRLHTTVYTKIQLGDLSSGSYCRRIM